MLKRNLQVMKLKKVIFPLKILKMQEINMEKSLQMLKKILASQVDFKNQKPLLQEIIEAKDHRVFDSIPLKYANCHVIYFFDCIFVMKVIKKSLKNFPEFDTCGAVTWWLIMLRTVLTLRITYYVFNKIITIPCIIGITIHSFVKKLILIRWEFAGLILKILEII